MSAVTIPAAVTNRTRSELAAGYPQGDGDKRLLPVPTRPTYTTLAASADEAAVDDLQVCVAVQVRLRLERKGVERLQIGKRGILLRRWIRRSGIGSHAAERLRTETL